MMEPEPSFVEQMLTTRHRNLPHKFIMIAFHPSNTQSSPICSGGTLSWVRDAIVLGEFNGYGFSRYDRFIEALTNALPRPEGRES